MRVIEKVTEEAMDDIIFTRKPRGWFYRRASFRRYIGVDNSADCAWTEAFRTRRQCLRWLRDPDLDAEDCGALGYGKN
jgi:hypothetical protein